MRDYKEELSHCETLIMKTIWDAKEDIALQELIRQMKPRYGKDYARTTVVTFVGKLVQKGFVNTYRKGRTAYIHSLRDEEEYKRQMIAEQVMFWYDDDPEKMLAALCSEGKLTAEQVGKIKEELADVD